MCIAFGPLETSQPVMHRICASLLVLSLSSLTAAQAAEIDVKPVDSGSTLIVIEGDFEHSDVDTFRTKVAALSTPRVTVAFKSDGGSLVAGIRIGTLIREKKFATVIPDGGVVRVGLRACLARRRAPVHGGGRDRRLPCGLRSQILRTGREQLGQCDPGRLPQSARPFGRRHPLPDQDGADVDPVDEPGGCERAGHHRGGVVAAAIDDAVQRGRRPRRTTAMARPNAGPPISCAR